MDDQAPHSDYADQYTVQSDDRLQTSTTTLIELLQAYAAEASAMRGGSSETAALLQRNRALADAVADWNESAFTHTGTNPLSLHDAEEDEYDEDLEEAAPAEAHVSVVSRWDLEVLNVADLLAAGRAAHQRLRPEESAADTEVAVDHPAAALYALLHEAGEPWFEISGVDVVSGIRLYVAPSGPQQDTEDFDAMDDLRDAAVVPEGSLLLSESW